MINDKFLIEMEHFLRPQFTAGKYEFILHFEYEMPDGIDIQKRLIK